MKKQKENKRYFIKDEALRNSDGDMFHYGDMAEVFKKIIRNTEPPYNVAVIGKWGLGKSSLIHLVTDACKNKKDKYLVQEINAWKYEKESLRKVFLKQLWQELNGQKVKSFEIIRREYEKIIYDDFDRTVQESEKNLWKRFKEWVKGMISTLTVGVVLGVATYFAVIVYKCVQYNLDGEIISQYFWTKDFWRKVFLSYCRNVATIWIIPLLVTFGKKVLDDYRARKTKKIELNFPLESVDDYEIYLESKIQEKMKEHQNLKIITVIDDLDRLSIEKIVEALDALKAFVGFDRCIFIVPFDDEIIKDALEKRRAVDCRNEEKNDIVESELILDKLFQFKLYLPPLLAFDIKEYAMNLVKQQAPDFLKDYCDEEMMSDLLRQIIIHPEVSTPRQVKKLLNAFINNALLAFEREASGKAQKNLLTSKDGLQQIAKLSVLQADFNHFYDTLLIDMDSIDKILDYQSGLDTLEMDLPEHLKEYFEPVKDNQGNVQYVTVKREYEPLINFLLGTKKYRVDSLAPYIYLAQDDISRKTGDEMQRRVVNALISGNVKTILTLLEQNSDVAEAICYYLSSSGEDIGEALRLAITIYPSIAEEYRAQLAKYIIVRSMEIEDEAFFYGLPAENYLAIAEQGKNLQFCSQFLDRYVEVLDSEQYYDSKVFGETVKCLISHHADLTSYQVEKLRNAVTMALNNSKTSVNEIMPIVCVDNEECFRTYWGLLWVEKICDCMQEDGDFEASMAANLVKAFRLLQNTYLHEMMECIIPLAEYTQFLPTLNALLDSELEDVPEISLRSAIDTEQATRLAEAAVSCGFENGEQEIFKVLMGLNYEVNEENQECFDSFAANFVHASAMDDVLVYCGQKGYFALLDNTITSLLKVIFVDDDNDELFGKVQTYLTKEQMESLMDMLRSESEKYSNTTTMYDRCLVIYSALAKDEQNAEALDNLMDSLIGKFNTYYNKPEYCDFISQAIGNVKGQLKQSTIDEFVEILTCRFSNYRHSYLQMLDRLSGKISAEVYGKMFPVLVQDVPQDEFDDTLRFIKNNEKSRPGDSESLTQYKDFLVSHIEFSENPNRILSTLKSSFGWISDVAQLLVAALRNEECDREQLAEVVRKFWNAADSEARIRDAADAVVSVSREDYQMISDIFKGVNVNIVGKIMEQVSEKIDENTSVEILLGLVHLVKESGVSECEVKLLEKSLELALPHQNQPENVIRLLKEVGEAKEQVSMDKASFATILAQGFCSTTSEIFKENIMRVVANVKIKAQFRRLLDDDDLEYYKKWKG